MNEQQIQQFLVRFFHANECEIVKEHAGYITVQLTKELDQRLMNRPFYWHYIENTGAPAEPMQLTFMTDETKCPSDVKGERIHFGSARLHQLFAAAKSLGMYVRFYENVKTTAHHSTALHPWLHLNVKISYICDRKKDIILSLGLNLIHGQIVNQFYEKLEPIRLTRKLPNYCFTLSPLIKEKSGLARLRKLIQTYIENDDHEWADLAKKRMNEELNLLERFYELDEQKQDLYLAEKEAIIERYDPKIEVNMINGGIIYLKQQVLSP